MSEKDLKNTVNETGQNSEISNQENSTPTEVTDSGFTNFTDAQQIRVNEIVVENKKKAYAKAQKELQSGKEFQEYLAWKNNDTKVKEEDNSNWQSKIEEINTNHKTELETKTNQLTALANNYKQAELKKVLLKHNVKSEILDDAYKLINDNFNYNIETNTISFKQEPDSITKEGKTITTDDFIKSWLDKREYFTSNSVKSTNLDTNIMKTGGKQNDQPVDFAKSLSDFMKVRL